MMITEHNSVKIRWLSFLAILCVVLGHCISGQGMLDRLIMAVFAQWHVPWFYVVSGMMLAYSLERHPLQKCCMSRLRTLVLPYFLWCCIGFLIVGGLGGHRADISHWLGVGTAFPAGNPHLWYLHCLLVFSFTSIFVWSVCCLIKAQFRVSLFAFIYCVLFATAIALKWSTLFGTPTSPFYFLLGFIAARYILAEKARSSAATFGAIFVIAVGLRLGWFMFDLHGQVEQILRMACVVAQFVVLWVGYDFVVSHIKPAMKSSRIIPWYVNSVFFVYCAHGFFLNLLKQIGMSGDVFLFVGTISATLLLAWTMRRFSPTAYAILTGGR